jgi:hypothetical protein
MIDKWLKKLELTDWTITLEPLDKEQVVCDCPPEDCYFVGVKYDCNTKHAVIYHDRELTEEDVVHELLHVKYNDWSEDQVNAETKRLLAGRPGRKKGGKNTVKRASKIIKNYKEKVKNERNKNLK